MPDRDRSRFVRARDLAMSQEVPDGLLELVLPQSVRGRHTKRLRKSLDLGCVPVAVVELAQRHLLRELVHGVLRDSSVRVVDVSLSGTADGAML